MANTLQLKNDIKKLKTALASKGLSASIKNKLKGKLEKAEKDLKSAAAPRKTTTTKSQLASLKELVKKKKYSIYKKSGVDLKKDSEEPALPIGRRVSKGLKGNQYGNKKSSKGNVYYEYRANRLDVKQPSKSAKYPKLEDGGMMAKGGSIPNNYDGMTDKELWDTWNYKQKVHFLEDHWDEYNQNKELGNRTKARTALLKWEELPKVIHMIVAEHKYQGQYADGGETFNADYWEDYYDGDRKINFMHPNVQIAEFVGSIVHESEEENNFILSKKDYENILDLSYKFHQKKGYLSASVVESMIMQESKGEYKKGGMMAHGGKLTKKDFFKKYEENEDENMHTENVVLLAENYGTESDIRDAKTILAKHESIGHLPTSLRQERDALHDKLWSKYVQSREDGGMMAEGGSIQDIQEYVAKKYFNGDERGFSVSKNMKGKYDFYIDNHEQFEADYGDALEETSKIEEDINKKFQSMAQGGVTEKEVVDSNAQMVLSNVKEVKHHAEELAQIVTKKSNIEAWVVAKIERASTDLSDITHYLEGQHDKMSMGGSVYNHLHKMDKK